LSEFIFTLKRKVFLLKAIAHHIQCIKRFYFNSILCFSLHKVYFLILLSANEDPPIERIHVVSTGWIRGQSFLLRITYLQLRALYLYGACIALLISFIDIFNKWKIEIFISNVRWNFFTHFYILFHKYKIGTCLLILLASL